MDAVELIALAASSSLLAGWRLYLVTFITGLGMKFGWVPLPDNLQMLDVLANNWVLAIAGVGTFLEFFADKIAWVDSVWDSIHSVIRPLGGALLALAILDASDPAFQIVAFLLGGGAAFASHAGKASARAAVNMSPEPVSNMVVSTGEDIATGGLLALAILNPVAAALIAAMMVGLTLWLIFAARKAIRKLLGLGEPKDVTPRA
ncbi:DUF4126 domain-containing protein [Sphingomicrobium sp. B8]|uniref:DUF4126 domain-containing protein n=1 Tax=Sphingomicrobium clamense TaxID=2851013 RepID=A0ABS6V785_9SPHN|nr:DUF4126 domain-containing protein [Sphingomicrobium sp. B8]MBW0145429.1 DUF4126 domain-containing protein [Sphingomicrobium sp. B8]